MHVGYVLYLQHRDFFYVKGISYRMFLANLIFVQFKFSRKLYVYVLHTSIVYCTEYVPTTYQMYGMYVRQGMGG